jgi:hypothetical protein
MSALDYFTLEETVRCMNSLAQRNGTRTLNENAPPVQGGLLTSRKIDRYRTSPYLEHTALAVIAEDQQRAINEASSVQFISEDGTVLYDDGKDSPAANFKARQSAVNKVRSLYKDMRGHMKPSEHGFCLADDGWSGHETAKFVAALKEAASEYGTTEEHVLNLCAAHAFFDEVSEARDQERAGPQLTKDETADLCHKVAEMLNISFRQANDFLVEYSGNKVHDGRGNVKQYRNLDESTEDVWNDLDFARDFVELHESREGYFWQADGSLRFISDEQYLNECCGAEETAKYAQWERNERLKSLMNGKGFSR